MKVGFIGLGLMGRAMVECLQKADYDVIVLGNRDRTGIEAALARGATEAANAREVAEASDVVMICVGTSDHVEANVYGDNGILAGVKSGQVVIDFGTSLPASTLKIGADMEAKGATYLDAPIGRTPAHAVDGLLNLMCSGDKAAFDRVKPVLDVMGENVFHLGKLGSGHTIKLINNYFGMTTACAMSEAFATADAAGIDRQQLFEVMAAGPLRSGMMEFVRNYAVDGDQNLAFSIANASKDVGYYRQMTQDMNLNSKMSACAGDALKAATEGGDGDKMVSQMVDWMSKSMGPA
ncbi:6-phosphogluconate dehydrogenase [Thalassobacter stenotrophicus]|uniref:2-hydroxy-3-oxopropionate reductase n=2 Tax=Thalassobacter stenotrophicus TaxID=266809 RepID=A0A0N7LT69_9RHOB|nr:MULTISPECIES: NAD(P)-dependent oxidoreductase [Thalassobacter]KGK79669.1 6-phosphogluconate dehydrogenase [Thalassobacter stenotrophicus]KGL01398.1 6-phosphogluconate dehydrogenase [Thalassobacter sp. 16PALIMAR09]PVZ49708.1 NAD(P)-dependent oxidoreductase [Thalassobacter stenotrophicus]CUH59866.1 2-hydroxy-3-oxopropionate reductase [Thalassobacter stenotrophicus]SHJ16137.1 2-hydroxy-3-oxopropionate reductase [Thalassobacter stenotrophicus DSM 16310]